MTSTPAAATRVVGDTAASIRPDPERLSSADSAQRDPRALRRRIHIIGSSPRSGTTLLAEAMSICFEVDKHCEHEESIASPHPGPGLVYVTKQPGELLSVILPLRVDPDLFVICCIRDPRDSSVSRHGSQPDCYWCGLRYWRLFLRHRSRLEGHPRVLFVKYEELVRDPDAMQQRIEAFLPFLRRRHRFSDFHRVAVPSSSSVRALREIRPIASASVGSWRTHLPRIKQQLTLHGGISRSLIEFGYESDDSWERLLAGVEPGRFRTKVGEYYRWRYLVGRRLRGVQAAWNALRARFGID